MLQIGDLFHMNLYYAPLEGITGYVYRNAFHKTFKPNIEKYFSPFISPGVNQPLTPKELRDIHPDNNKGLKLIPQILANNPDDFLLASTYIKDLGYNEINLNLGCPSGTVVAKGKGSGLLADTDKLLRMLDKIYDKTDMEISVKTRIGKDDPDEFPELLEIFNRFPIKELIIHPRIRTDFYKNTPNMEMFELAYNESKNPVCYNGDVVDINGFKQKADKYSNMTAVMIGRGFLKNPLLAGEISGEHIDKKLIKQFHDELLAGYEEVMSGEKPVLYKMKEIWCYMMDLYKDCDGIEKHAKKIRKSEKLGTYKEAVDVLFKERC